MRKHWVVALLLALPCCGGSDEGGDVGESCTARSDCKSGLACIGQVCTKGETENVGSRSALGESCRARNDCGGSLACIGGVCVSAQVNVSIAAKSCTRVECEARADCCADFLPSPNCAVYEQDCATDPIYCPTFRSLCECDRDCEDNLCVERATPCASHDECGSLLTPVCVEGQCAECGEHGDCPDDTDRCIQGRCEAPCTADEECPLLHACENGECAEVGCGTDRECYFLLGDARATCTDAACSIPCERDSDCTQRLGESSFQVCDAGKCIFVGCETDAECRAYLGLESTSDGVRAVCQ